ncbi:MAG: NfeD family protein [Verrucomicrobiota bacterium]
MSGSGKKVRFGAYVTLAMLGVFLVAQRTDDNAETAPAAAEPDAPAEEANENAEEKASLLAGKVISLKIGTDDLTDGTRLYDLRKLLKAADEEGAEAVVFEINTAAGYDPELAGLLLGDLPQIKTRLISWVNPSALGMGALLAIGSNEVYVTPVAFIGGAAPDEPEEGEGNAAQALSILRAQAKSAAASKGQLAELAEAFIDAEIELRLEPKEGKKETLVDDDEVLTLTADQALKEYEHGALLANGTAESVAEVIEAAGLEGEVYETTPRDWSEDRDREAIGGAFVDENRDEPVEAPFGKLPETHFGGKILVMKVGPEDLINLNRFEFMEKVMEKARAEKPEALILDMHSPGGYAFQTIDFMTAPLMRLPFPTYTFVNTKAKSAGALVAIATDHIYMSPVSTIGAALVVTGSGDDVEGNMEKKISASIDSSIRNIAIAKGRDVDLCLAFVTDETKIVRDGAVLCDVGEVLDLNAIEATKDWDGDGEPLLAKGMADSIEDLVAQEGLEGEILEIRATPLEAFAQWTFAWGGLLIFLGLAGAYVEANSPGFGLPGIIAVLSFGIFFFGNYAAGNLAGWETVVVFAIGCVLVLLELFVFSGTMVLGVIGAILMFGSLAFALVNQADWTELTSGALSSDQTAGGALRTMFTFPLLSIAIAIILTVALICLLMRFLPGIKPVQWLILNDSVQGAVAVEGGPAAGGTETAERPGTGILGKTGKAETDLRPAGLARIDDEMRDVTTEGEFVPRGSEVRVTAVQGIEIVVTKIDSE